MGRRRRGRFKKWFREKGAKKILGGLERFGSMIPGVGGIISKGAGLLKERLGNRAAMKDMGVQYVGHVAEAVDTATNRIERDNRKNVFSDDAGKVAKMARLKKIGGYVAMGIAGVLLLIVLPIVLIKNSSKNRKRR
ncbi:MAG: hypothetical protein COA58_02910 [Bacteroidetes bacterium]|nr:MAG: hypothetical protein COA58_02910 [Bacteroidota bacterium]